MEALETWQEEWFERFGSGPIQESWKFWTSDGNFFVKPDPPR